MTSATATSKILPAGNDWRVVASDLIVILSLSVLAGGYGFSVLTGWHPVVTGLIVFILYVWIYLIGRANYINDLKEEMMGLTVITILEVVVLVVATVVTAIIWLLSYISQYYFGDVFSFGPTVFIVWIVLNAIFWILDHTPDSGEGDYEPLHDW